VEPNYNLELIYNMEHAFMVINRFEDIEAWKDSRNLVKEVYGVFRDCRDYGFRDQIQRAAISIMSNIAEGFDRGSNKEFTQFLIIARGSVAEVKSLCYAAKDIGYVSEEKFVALQEIAIRVSGLINGFIHYLKKSDRKF
jgi:four helix bundle protein